MRAEKLERLRADFKNLLPSIAEVEKQIQGLEREADSEKEMRYLARLLYAGQIVEQCGLLYSFNEQTLTELLITNKSALQKPPNGMEVDNLCEGFPSTSFRKN